ncbi:MAG: phosphonate metabolism protein/1,5-bisphosphokinase (PRPP-forming) PhnN [Rhizobiaceae bacterium]|nr:phosphonate metabolism protein/1,5-bisphosphokinase (PRPP-forming) PhnN [Rhizobiaceae bacterium]
MLEVSLPHFACEDQAGPAHGASAHLPIGPGVFIAVVGPSGAGKDTLINLARNMLQNRPAGAETQFARRVITRAADASAEDHDTMDEAAFAAAEAAGRFSVTWRAHGLSYGLPAEIDRIIADGGVVVANSSRAALAAISGRFENVVVVQVTAPRDKLAERLAARGRETRDDILARLERATLVADLPGSVIVENKGHPGEAAGKLIAVIEKAAARAALSGLV